MKTGEKDYTQSEAHKMKWEHFTVYVQEHISCASLLYMAENN